MIKFIEVLRLNIIGKGSIGIKWKNLRKYDEKL